MTAWKIKAASAHWLKKVEQGGFETAKQGKVLSFPTKAEADVVCEEARGFRTGLRFEVVEVPKILVFGSRHWVEQSAIERELKKFPAGTIVVHGAAPGADNIAGDVALRLGFEVRPYPADWDHYALAAGPLRNAQMLQEEHPDKFGIGLDGAICFHKDPNLGKGSADMRERLRAADPPIEPQVFRR